MDTVEEILEKVILDIHGSSKILVGNNIIDFKRP